MIPQAQQPEKEVGKPTDLRHEKGEVGEGQEMGDEPKNRTAAMI